LENRQDEFAHVEKEANSLLRGENILTPLACQYRINIIHMPSFEDWQSWVIFQEETQVTVWHIHWRRLFDLERFFQPMSGLKYGWHQTPTYEIKKLMLLTKEEFEPFLPIPKDAPSPKAMLDGTQWYICLYEDEMAEVFEWNEGYVREENALNNWTKRWQELSASKLQGGATDEL
jgi:hypothetical protein